MLLLTLASPALRVGYRISLSKETVKYRMKDSGEIGQQSQKNILFFKAEAQQCLLQYISRLVLGGHRNKRSW